MVDGGVEVGRSPLDQRPRIVLLLFLESDGVRRPRRRESRPPPVTRQIITIHERLIRRKPFQFERVVQRHRSRGENINAF